MEVMIILITHFSFYLYIITNYTFQEIDNVYGNVEPWLVKVKHHDLNLRSRSKSQ